MRFVSILNEPALCRESERIWRQLEDDLARTCTTCWGVIEHGTYVVDPDPLYCSVYGRRNFPDFYAETRDLLPIGALP